MIKLKGINDTWVKLLAIFSVKQRRKYSVMVLWGVVNALFEIVGISVLLHTVLSILRPNFIQHNIFTAYLSRIFGVEGQIQFVAIITVILFLVYVIKNILIVQINKAQVKFAYETTDKISAKRYHEIAHNDLLYFKKRKSSEIINELFGAALYLPEMVIIPSIMLLSELSILVLMLGAIFVYKPFLFFFTFITILPTAGILIYFNKSRLGRKGKKVHLINPVIYENISQLTNGIANIKLWNGTKYFINEYDKNKKESFELKQSIYVSSQFIPMRIYEVVAISGILCVVLFSLIYNKGNDNLITYISIYAGVSFRLLPSVNRILGAFNNLATNSYALDYFSTSKESETVPESSNDIEEIGFKNSIDLENIGFSYTEDEAILKDVDLTINKGDFIGIIGSSGSGKSTLVNVIASLLKPEKGKLSIDGNEVNEENIDAYRYLFSYVKQDVFMLNKSIIDNVAFLQDQDKVDLDKVISCLKQVNLWDWVDSLENKLQTSVGELGNQISGGQRQRIALARALYKDAEIFIFDEATNNLDTKSVEQTLEAIAHLKDSGKTALFITHKNDELKMCNRVYSLDKENLIKVEKA
jgi:ABC-type multidrug transport system fused ATPase/permease subunit